MKQKRRAILSVATFTIVFLVVTVFLLRRGDSQASPQENLSTFDLLPVPLKIKEYSWTRLMDDKPDDGRLKQSADGKSLSYFYDKNTDTIWFRLELYNEIDLNTPAVSVAIDTDADQNNGVNWYGRNSKFKFDKMLSVGPLRKQGDRHIGYNGITNEQGVRDLNWINEKKNIITFYFDKGTNGYFLGVKRSEIGPSLKRINVIGSVGANALWNDDIGDEGFATIGFK